MTVFHQVFEAFGLELAIKQTEIMMQKSHPNELRPDPKISLEEVFLRNVKQFKYLGPSILMTEVLRTKSTIG